MCYIKRKTPPSVGNYAKRYLVVCFLLLLKVAHVIIYDIANTFGTPITGSAGENSTKESFGVQDHKGSVTHSAVREETANTGSHDPAASCSSESPHHMHGTGTGEIDSSDSKEQRVARCGWAGPTAV